MHNIKIFSAIALLLAGFSLLGGTSVHAAGYSTYTDIGGSGWDNYSSYGWDNYSTGGWDNYYTTGWDGYVDTGWDNYSSYGWDDYNSYGWDTYNTYGWDTYDSYGWDNYSSPGWDNFSSTGWDNFSSTGWDNFSAPSYDVYDVYDVYQTYNTYDVYDMYSYYTPSYYTPTYYSSPSFYSAPVGSSKSFFTSAPISVSKPVGKSNPVSYPVSNITTTNIDNSIHDSFNITDSYNTNIIDSGNTTVTTINPAIPYYPIVHAQPRVALSQIPYTGFDLGPLGNTVYWAALALFAIAAAYLVVYYLPRLSLGKTNLPSLSFDGSALRAPRVFSQPTSGFKFSAPATANTARDAMTRIASEDGGAPRIVITRS